MRIITLIVTALLATQPSPHMSDWTIRGHIPPEQFIIQSHRGAGELAPENTLEAFQLGWKLGTYPESDIRTTRDEIIVAFHDNNFARVVKGVSPEMRNKGVKDITFDELAKLDVGGWKGEQFVGRHVSRISEVFALMSDHPERHLYLDIKNVSLEQLAQEVKQHRVEAQVVLASTDYAIIRQWKKLIPQSQTLLWMGGKEDALKKRFEELRKSDFADVTQLQIHVHLPGGADQVQRNSTDPFVESDDFLIAAGKELRERKILFQSLPYGGSTPEVYCKLLDLGVMSFATDHPDVTLAAVKQYYAEH